MKLKMKTNQSDSEKTQSSHQKIASYLAAASAAVINTTGTHPLDTISKRLQNNPNVRFSPWHAAASFNQFYAIACLRESGSNSSIWNGYTAALTYRVTACTVTLGSQPLTQQLLIKKYGHEISQWTGEKYTSTVTHMLSGALYGVIEVAFLPLDKWKILRQMNHTMPFIDLVKQQKNNLYAGSSITCLRNITAYPTLFGVSDLANKYFPHDSQQSTIPFYQRLVTSSAGAIASVIVSSATDVVKTIIQTQSPPFSGQKLDSATKVVAQVYGQDGIYGFFRGIWPRLGSIVPRLTFLKAISEELVPIINKALDAHSPRGPTN